MSNRPLFPSSAGQNRAMRLRAGAMGLFALAGLALLPTEKTHAAQDPPSSPIGKAAAASGPLTTPMAVEWKFTSSLSPNNPAAPVAAGDTVYFCAGQRVYAVDRQSGAEKWRYPSEGVLPGEVLTSPVVDGSSLFFAAGEDMYALNTANGQPKWKKFHVPGGINSSPLVAGEGVYFSASGNDDSRFYGIKIATGDSLPGLWKKGVPAGGDLGNDVTLANGVLYYVTGNQTIHAVDQTSGVQKWAQRVDADVQNSQPTIVGDSMYLTTGNQLSSWRVASGQKKWMIPLPAEAATPAVVDENGTSYVVTTDNTVFAVDYKGRGAWKHGVRIDDAPIARPTLANGQLIIGTGQGGIYVLDTATGAVKWTYMVQPSGTDASHVPVSVRGFVDPGCVRRFFVRPYR